MEFNDCQEIIARLSCHGILLKRCARGAGGVVCSTRQRNVQQMSAMLKDGRLFAQFFFAHQGSRACLRLRINTLSGCVDELNDEDEAMVDLDKQVFASRIACCVGRPSVVVHQSGGGSAQKQCRLALQSAIFLFFSSLQTLLLIAVAVIGLWGRD